MKSFVMISLIKFVPISISSFIFSFPTSIYLLIILARAPYDDNNISYQTLNDKAFLHRLPQTR